MLIKSLTAARTIQLLEKRFTFTPALTIPCLLGVLIAPSLCLAESYFKVTNPEGRIEIKSTITPDEARRGYEIISNTGRVVKVVEPELTEEDYAAMSEAERKEMLEKERKEKEARYDLDLMLKYSNLGDLEAERRRKLSEFDISISILKGNLTVLRENAERQRSLAASIERNGNPVPQKIQDNITEIEREMSETLQSINAREKEKNAANVKYDTDAKRLQGLLNKTKVNS